MTSDGEPLAPGQRPSAAHLRELDMQARYHRDRHRLYAARLGSSRPVSQTKLRELKRKREVAEAHLRHAKQDQAGRPAAEQPPEPADSSVEPR